MNLQGQVQSTCLLLVPKLVQSTSLMTNFGIRDMEVPGTFYVEPMDPVSPKF